MKKIILTLPLIGLWFYCLSSSKKLPRNIFVAHCFLFGYFIGSNLFLNNLIWIVPYFFEQPIKWMILLNHLWITWFYLLLLLTVLNNRLDPWLYPRTWRLKLKRWS